MKKKVCLITGGAGFLGKKYCEFFLKKNYVVLCVDNSKKNLKFIKSLNYRDLFVYECDITSEKKVQKLFRIIKKSFSIDVLINNAAIDAIPFKKKDSPKFPTSKMWDEEINVSLKGSFFMIKFFGEEMYRKKRGSIINSFSKIFKTSVSHWAFVWLWLAEL